MSEPLTSHEIEDVLSSIRRLVSEDLRPARAAMVAARAGTEAAGKPEGEKLLLTPALRVVTADEGPAEEIIPAAQDTRTEEVIVSVPEDGPVGGETTPDAFLMAETGFSGPATFPADEVYDDAGLEEGGPPRPGLLTGEGEVLWAAAGEPVEDTAEAARPHGHWTAQDIPGADWAEGDWAEADAVPFIAHPRKPDLTIDPPIADPLARAWADHAEAAVRAELDDAIAARLSGVMPPPEAPQAAADPAPQAEAAPGAGLFDTADPAVDLAFDEEMLREIVRDIIREELAGTLGERITRNVRKLVRVEINRALTAREFE